MASEARKVWVDAKTKAGPAVEGLKLKDDYGPMLDSVTELGKKLLSQAEALQKMMAQYEVGLKKLDGMRKVYDQKIENEIKTNGNSAAKNALGQLLKQTKQPCRHATAETANIANACNAAAKQAIGINKMKHDLFIN